MGNSFTKSDSEESRKIKKLKSRLKKRDTIIFQLREKVNSLQTKKANQQSQQSQQSQPNQPTKSKRDIQYKNLVIEGGGTKGIAYCSAVEVLEQMGILKHITKYAGSSAGAITAALLAVGYNASDAKQIVSNTNFGEFLDDKFGYVRDGYKLLTDFGICPGSTFLSFMKSKMKDKTGDEDYTFKQLWDDHQKELVVTGCDLTEMETTYFHYKTTPDMPIALAVRISMSIPYLFVPIEQDTHFYVDGGTIDNYPIHVFDGAYPGDPDAKFGTIPPNEETLGLKILTPDEEVSYKLMTKHNDIDSIKDFTLSLMNTLMIANERKYVSKRHWERTVVIKVPNIPLTKFDLSKEEIDQLLEAGRTGVSEYFKA